MRDASSGERQPHRDYPEWFAFFTGSAGGGESEIRRYILKPTCWEAIIALPGATCFTTPGLPPISGYSLIKKAAERKAITTDQYLKPQCQNA